MEDSKISLHLVFLVLLSLRVMADQINNTIDFTTPYASNQSSPISTTINAPADQSETTTVRVNATCSRWLTDNHVGMIAVASTGGLILCLLVTTLVLACWVCHLQRHAHAPRPCRSNVDLVSGTGYWGTDRPEASGGVAGPCDASVMMEEVRVDRQVREGETDQAEFDEDLEDEAEREAMESRPEEEVPLQKKSTPLRDSCLDVPQDLESMPLMV